MKYVIYCAVCTKTNKKYVGFSSDFQRRILQHKKQSLVSHPKTKFHRAIKKYGFDAFEFNILYEGDDREYCLNVMENKFIVEYNTTDNDFGYNMTFGGDGVNPTVEVRKKMSESRKGKMPWNRGLTKQSSNIVKEIGKKWQK